MLRSSFRRFSSTFYRPGTTYLLGQLKLGPDLVSHHLPKKPSNAVDVASDHNRIDPEKVLAKLRRTGNVSTRENIEGVNLRLSTPYPHAQWFDIYERTLTDKQIVEQMEQFRLQIDSDLKCRKLYSDFITCYSRELKRFGINDLSLKLDEFPVDKSSLWSQSESRKTASRTKKLVQCVADSFSESKQNLAIINKRMKLKRQPPEFYLHQQFVISLGKKDVSKLIDIYFDFPSQKALHLTEYEFEKFMSLILGYRMSKEDRIAHSGKLISLFKSLLSDRIPLTSFELTKYVFFTIRNLTEYRQLPTQECYEDVMKLQKSFTFNPAIWNLILTQFPNHKLEIIKQMSRNTILNRDLTRKLVQACTTPAQLVNMLSIIKFTHSHIDQMLFEDILIKLVDLGFYSFAKSILNLILNAQTRKSTYSKGRSILRRKSQRFINNQIEAFNGVLLYRARNLSEDIVRKHYSRYLYYIFKPSPMMMASFLESLTNPKSFTDNKRFELKDLLETMVKFQIPLLNSSALSILVALTNNQSEQHFIDMDIVGLLNELVYESIAYNESLHKYSIDGRYDKKYLGKFINKQVGSSVALELKAIFKLSFNVFKRWPSSEKDATYSKKRIHVKTRLLKIYDQLVAVGD